MSNPLKNMIMETKEFQFKGLTLSGFAMLFLNILLTVLSAVMVVAGFVWCLHELLAGLLIGVGLYFVGSHTLCLGRLRDGRTRRGASDDVFREI